MVKKLFIRPHPSKFTPPGELQVGWVFIDYTGRHELPWGAVGLGSGIADQNTRLENMIAELRVKQAELGNISDFEIEDQRPSGLT